MPCALAADTRPRYPHLGPRPTSAPGCSPTGYHGAVQAGVQPGSTVYVAGAGPVGLASAASAQLLGASVVIVGDLNKERLAQARSMGASEGREAQRASLCHTRGGTKNPR